MDIISGLIGLIFFLACCVTITRVGEIRDEAKRQTKLLEQIAKQTMTEEAEKIASVLYPNPLAEEKSGFPTFLVVLIIVIVVAVVVAMAVRG